MTGELERVWKEGTVAYYMYYFWHVSAATEESINLRIGGTLAEVRAVHLPNRSHGVNAHPNLFSAHKLCLVDCSY
jgi:hypothetical protein